MINVLFAVFARIRGWGEGGWDYWVGERPECARAQKFTLRVAFNWSDIIGFSDDGLEA